MPIEYDCFLSVPALECSLLAYINDFFLPRSIYGKVLKSMELFVWCYITLGCITLLILSRHILQLLPALPI